MCTNTLPRPYSPTAICMAFTFALDITADGQEA